MGVAAKLLAYSLLMLAAPLAAFFAASAGRLDPVVNALTAGRVQLDDASRLVAGGLAGIVCANLVIAAYVWSAWHEPAPEPKAHGKDE